MSSVKPSAITKKPDLIIIEPSKGWVPLRLRELWEYRELLYFLVWRDIKVRYKQTLLGVAWAIIQPFFTMVVFSIFFGELGKMPSDGIPYPIFVYCGLLPWQLFAYALGQSSASLVTNQNLVTKVYFPRIMLPVSSVMAGLVDFAAAFIVLIVMMFYFNIRPTLAIMVLPILLLFTVITALSIGIWLSAINVKYRDVTYTIPFLTQFWLFLTPIAYSSSIVPEQWRLAYGVNPMAGVVDGFRWALLGSESPPSSLLWISLIVVLVLFVSGLYYFRRVERSFADEI